jgi:cell shape-determining protein MreD
MSIIGIVLALFTASLARNFSNAHQLEHWARTIVILCANSLAFGIVWVVKFLVLNRIFQPNLATKKDADAESSPQGDTEWEGSVP